MKNKNFLVDRAIAHRGIHYLFLENTISAFEMAIEMNYTIEFDVHLSSDDEIVVFHDYSLKRLFHKDLLIKDLSLKELRKYSVCTLGEVLNLVSGRVPIIIEIKVCRKKLYQKLIDMLDNYMGLFAIQSFFPQCILYFKKYRPNYIRGFLFYNLAKVSFFEKILFNYKLLSFLLKPDFIGINKSSLFLKRIQSLRNKYILIGYTIKNNHEYLKYLDYADNFIFDIKKQETVPLRTVSQKE